MDKNYDSFLEMAVALVKKKKSPATLDTITKEVFAGISASELQTAQFQVDFMLSGYFVCCGENKSGDQLWDLKTRQHSSFLDKDGGYQEEDDEAAQNELKEGDGSEEVITSDDEDDVKDEKDEIQEDLGLVSMDHSEGDDESVAGEDDDDEDTKEEDLDDIEVELLK